MRGDAEKLVRALTRRGDVPAGGFRYELGADRWTLSTQIRLMLGLPDDEVMTTQTLVDLQHPDDADAVAEATRAVTEGRSFHHFYRIVTRTGRVLSVFVVGQVIDGDDGSGPIMVGYLIDLTPTRRRTELDQEFAAITAGFDDVDEHTRREVVLEQASGLLMGILGISAREATSLLESTADRLATLSEVVALHMVDHFERAAGITRSMRQMRREVDDVLQREQAPADPVTPGDAAPDRAHRHD